MSRRLKAVVAAPQSVERDPKRSLATWVEGRYGGSTLKVARGIECSVHWAVIGGGYTINIMDDTLDGRWQNHNEAKVEAERRLLLRVRYALANLEARRAS